jgi:predicted dienelactone hydrolase
MPASFKQLLGFVARMRRTILFCLLAALSSPLLSGCSDSYPGEAEFGVGIRPMMSNDGSFASAIFYPSHVGDELSFVGPYDVRGIRDAAPAPGRFPLIVLSHGSGGSMFSHHNLASFLAGHGYVVAAIEHPADNHRDSSRAGSVQVHKQRPKQVSDLLDELTQDGIAGLVDATNVGFIGFSAGTVTGLTLAGWPLAPSRIEEYCKSRAAPPIFCEGIRSGSVTHDTAVNSDARIKSWLLLAPMGLWFDRRPPILRKPIGLIIAEQDEELEWDANVSPVVNSAEQLLLLEIVRDGSHSTFLSPCTQRLHTARPDLCFEPTGVDRVAVHDRVNTLALAFFNRTLKRTR